MAEVEFKREIRRQGGSLVVSLPTELLVAADMKEGYTVVLTLSGDGILIRKAVGDSK